DMDRTRRMLDLEVRRWTKGEQDLNLAALTGDTSVFDTDKVVRAAFTKKVWDEKAKDALEKPPADDEAWLLDQQPATGAQIQEALKREYYTQYVREWTNMLTSIELRPVRSPDEVRRRMEVLNVGGSSPLLENLFAQVTSNLVLTLPKPGFALPPTPDAQTVTDTFFPLAKLQPAKIPPFLKKFMPSGGARGLDLSRYESLLADFAKAVDGAKDAASAAGVAKSWRGEVNNLSSVIANQQQNHTYEAVLDQLWVRPLRRMVDALDAETRQGLNYKWCADVFTLHRNELHGRYPFAKGGSDANLDALVELYGGKGKLWDFAKQSLDGKVVEAEQGSFKRLGGESVTDSLLSYLTHAKTVREAVFPGDAPNPAVDFTVQIHIPKLPNIQGVNYFVDDQQARQDSGPLEAPFSMHWPGNPKGPKRSSISIKLTGTRPFTIGCHGEQECSGPFAFLRLLEQGKLIPRGPRSFTMAWVADLGGAAPAEVSIDFAWQRSVSVFFGREGRHAQPLLGVFRALEPPAAIVPGVEGCK
ncbi:MAG TPA: ImcF-related family protein, partial [Myxococcales bacterium]|nr:ImcF-related family protein [Myxococcales bacterium]